MGAGIARDTSLKAWEEKQASLPNSKKLVFEKISEMVNRTGSNPTRLEIEQELRQKYPGMQVKPRVRELLQDGFIVEGYKRACFISRKRVYTLARATEEEYEAKQREPKLQWIKCAHCDGAGGSYAANGGQGQR